MEKVLDVAKGLLAGFVECLLHPVSKVTDTVQKEDMKKGVIKGAIIALVLSIVSVLATIRAIFLAFDGDLYKSTREAYIDELNPMLSILRTFLIYIVLILAVAFVLFLISKLVKDQKSLPYTLSMTVNSSVVLTVGAVLALAVCFWTPLSILVITLATLHSFITLLVSFMSSLSNISTDKLVLVSVVLLTIVGVVLMIISLIKYDRKLSDYADEKYAEKTQFSDVMYYKGIHAKKKAEKQVKDALDSLNSISDLSSMLGY